MEKKTKTAKILRMYAHGIFTVKEIAEAVGCKPEYVRVVARQRARNKLSQADRRYLASDRGRARIRATNSERYRRQKKIADMDAVRAASREAYKKAKASGLEVKLATRAAGQAYLRALYAKEAAHA